MKILTTIALSIYNFFEYLAVARQAGILVQQGRPQEAVDLISRSWIIQYLLFFLKFLAGNLYMVVSEGSEPLFRRLTS